MIKSFNVNIEYMDITFDVYGKADFSNEEFGRYLDIHEMEIDLDGNQLYNILSEEACTKITDLAVEMLRG